MTKTGSKAPDFTLMDESGKAVSLKDFRGRKVALYCYPKDMTPGCTTQACNLRDHDAALRKAGIVVLGLSPDPSKSHAKFRAKHELPFTLLADPEKVLLQKLGVWAEKSMYGRKYMGVLRTTFLIDEDGKVAGIIEKPKVGDHAAEILAGFGV